MRSCLSTRAQTCTAPFIRHQLAPIRPILLQKPPGCRNRCGRSPIQCRSDHTAAGTGLTQADKQRCMPPLREYQREIIELIKDNNVIVTLPTGAGKTRIATEVICRKLGSLKQAGQVAVFLAPTNPLADQIQLMLQEQPPLRCQAFHGDTGRVSIGTWDAAKWQEKLQELDVIVMTPELLLHCLAHASLKMSQIGILVFDEAHHCASDHPYAQLMEDFYHTSDINSRPQIIGLTASPVGVEGLMPTGKKKKKSKGKGDAGAGQEYGLQGRMNARLITLDEKHRPELRETTPVPLDEFVNYDDMDVGNRLLQEAKAELEAANKDCLVYLTTGDPLQPRVIQVDARTRCATILTQLRHQAVLAEAGELEGGGDPVLKYFADINSPSVGSMKALVKQVNGVKYCLGALGPWGAAAAAHLDLLSAVPDSAAGEGLGGDGLEVVEEGEGDEEQEEEEGADKDAGDVAAGVGGMSDMELAKLMQDDDLGADADTLIEDLRRCLNGIHSYLQKLSARRPAVLPQSDLAAALQPAGGAASFDAMSAAELSAVAPLLLGLVGKSSVLLVITLLTELLVEDERAQEQILNDPALHAAASQPSLRAEGILQRISGQLLQQVPFRVLQAQIWPNLPAPSLWPSSMPPLLSPKVKQVARHLAERQQAAVQGQDWAAIVFVETKLTALVLYKLLCSCPDMRQQLRAGVLIGDTEGAEGTAELSMSHSRQKAMIRRFRDCELNVLVCTNIGSEGMDFRQCQMVVAYDQPKHVTQYIQSRGRARAKGSTYAWLRPNSEEQKQVEAQKERLLDDSAKLEAHAAKVSKETRQELREHGGRPPPLRDTQEPHNDAHLVTAQGGVATMRLAQVLLAGYCARLPGTDDRLYNPQALYKTTEEQGEGCRTYRTTIYLPPGASETPIVQGAKHQNSKAAKNAAALAAIKQLHQEGKMTDYLFPPWVSAHHAQQLAAEVIPPFQHTKCLQSPLQPRTLNLQPQQTVTPHLHSFECTPPSNQHGNEVTAALLQLAVGDPMRCKAVPGGSGCGNSSSGAKRVSFGVLTWEQLPGAVGGRSTGGSPVQLEFPAWMPSDQQEPSSVRVVYQGTVTLSAAELLTMMKYQQCLNNTIKKLLGMKRADTEESQSEMQRQFGGVFKPLNPTAFNDNIGYTDLSAAAAAQSAGDAQAAVAALQGAPLCYLFAPLQQQSATINWQAITRMGEGLRLAADVMTDAASDISPSKTDATAAATAAVPAGTSARHVSQPCLQDAVLIAGHSSLLYLSGGVSDITPAKPISFEWSSATDSGTADNHTQYFSKRYGVHGLREELPMLEVTHFERQKALNPFGPPSRQPRVRSAGAAHMPTNFTTAEAAVAACNFTFPHTDQQAAQADAQHLDQQAARYLPQDLSWVLPLSAHEWQELQLLPACMYRIDSLLRLQQAQQQLSILAAAAGVSGWQGYLPPQLLMIAVTARSAQEQFDLEGLEFLGDAVLKFLSTNYLLQPEVNDTGKNEGELSVAKARIIRNVELARKAQDPRLSLQHLLHLLPYQSDHYTPTGHLPAVQQAGTASITAAVGPVGLYAPAQQQISIPCPGGKTLADGVEALIGAFYLAASAEPAAAAAEGSGAPFGCEGGGGGLPVSEAGLAAAAAFCEAAGVLPKGSAASACKPCLGAFATTPSTNTHSNAGKHAQHTPDLQQLQQHVLGHTFSNPALLHQALTHVSRAGGCSYQRLEFLGDAVLDLIVSSWLVLQLGQALQQQAGAAGSVTSVSAPAQLTHGRSALVNNDYLAAAAVAAQLHQHLRAHSGPLKRAIQRFAAKQQQQQQGGQQTDASPSTGGSSPGARAFAVLAAAAATTMAQGAGAASVARARSWGLEDEAIWQDVWAGKASLGAGEDQEDGQAAAEGGAGCAAGVESVGAADGAVGTARSPAAGAAAVKQRAPKALADIVESLVGAVLVDSSSGSTGAGGSSSRVGGSSYNWAAAWKAVRLLLPGMTGL